MLRYGLAGASQIPSKRSCSSWARGHGVRRDPLAFGTCVAETRVEHRVCLVRGVVVADDADEHVPTLPLETVDTIGPWPPP